MRTGAHATNRASAALDGRQMVKTSKFLALVLRHNPGRIGITLDAAGWVDISVLLEAVNAHSRPLTRAALDQVVAENDKKRFEIDPSGTRIRASQGHSVPVELGYPVAAPPPVLFHGTIAASLDSIFRSAWNRAAGTTCTSPRTRPRRRASGHGADEWSCSKSRRGGWPRTGTNSTSARTASGSPRACLPPTCGD